jgi:hypothetical protein
MRSITTHNLLVGKGAVGVRPNISALIHNFPLTVAQLAIYVVKPRASATAPLQDHAKAALSQAQVQAVF